MRYIALVDGKAGAYGVVVPDLPGCTSAGSTTDEALRNAVEAVGESLHPTTIGRRDYFHSAPKTILREDMMNVDFDCAFAQPQFVRDLLI